MGSLRSSMPISFGYLRFIHDETDPIALQQGMVVISIDVFIGYDTYTSTHRQKVSKLTALGYINVYLS